MHTHNVKTWFAAAASAALLFVPLATASTADTGGTSAAASVGDAPAAVRDSASAPALRVTTLLSGLDIPWDTAFLPNGAMLVTERERKRILLRSPRGTVRTVVDDPPGVWAAGETGLMSLAVDPAFADNRRFYTCHGATLPGGRHDVRVVAWRLDGSGDRARRVEVLVGGIPATSGRHGGCRLEIARGGRLWVGTGDATIGTNPQRLRSLGGKVLRVDRFTGRGVRGNPYAKAPNADRRRVFSHGHRNVQGLAERPAGGMWAVEHGTYRDDEVNRLYRGGDYGWAPGPSYDESRPMTDHRLAGRQRVARWSSGNPTVATAGAAWLTHPRWGAWRGRLAVASLKDSSLRVLRFDRSPKLLSVRKPPALDGRFGRLRSLTVGPGGALFVTTANGGGRDRVLRVVPRR